MKTNRTHRTMLLGTLGAALATAAFAEPSIVTQPASLTVKQGETASFSVSATGVALSYQWRKDGVEIPGATGATCALGLARPEQAGSYTVVVSDAAGSVTSSPPALLFVNPVSPGVLVAWGRPDCFPSGSIVVGPNGATAIAAGDCHTVALTGDGSVMAWGGNAYGQATVPLAARSGVTAIAAGGFHTVAIKSDGSVVAWGRGGEGQTTVPAALTGVVAIGAGWYHTVALRIDGSVVAWGGNQDGQTMVPAGALNGVTAIAVGGSHTVALKSDGSVVTWGYNCCGEPAVPLEAQSGMKAFAGGCGHTVGLKSDGSVLAWGINHNGQTDVPAGAQSGVTAVAAGCGHSVALKSDGSVLAWGAQFNGQTTVPEAAKSRVTAIAAGGYHSVAIVTPLPPSILTPPSSQTVIGGASTSLTVVAEGFPLYYQWRKDGVDIVGATNATYSLPVTRPSDAGSYTVVVSNPGGTVTSAPPAVLTVNVVPPEFVAQPTSLTVSEGRTASFTVEATGSLLRYQWRKDGVNIPGATGATCALGLARPGQAGSYSVVVTNESGAVTSAPPVTLTVLPATPGMALDWSYDCCGSIVETPVGAQRGVVAMALGSSHAAALKDDGSVVAWGDNSYGKTSVPQAAQSEVTAIAAGSEYTVALKRDGSVLAWGNNSAGQTIVPTGARSGVVAIAAGDSHVAALKSDGSVLVWGSNSAGQTNVPLAARSGVAAIAAGGAHTVALKRDGSALAWGRNSSQQTNVPLAAQSGITAVAAGSEHTVASKRDGSLLAWGANVSGQTNVPAAASSGVIAIAAGASHNVAMKEDGSVLAWGRSSEGQTRAPAGLSGVVAIAAGVNRSASVVVPTTPSILAPPEAQSVLAEEHARFTVTASGFPLYYQWRKDGVDIPGARSATHEVWSATPDHAGDYTVVVHNPAGSVTSQVATLTVRVFAPVITYQPVSQIVADGGSVTFSVDAFGAPAPSYQWRFNGVPIGWATGRMLQLDGITPNQAGSYSVVVSNYAGSVTSQVATLTVYSILQFSGARSSARENGNVATVSVRQSAGTTEAVTVTYATSDGTALAGQDYAATSGTLTFGPGETEKTFTIPMLDDTLPEGPEYLFVTLTRLAGPAFFGAIASTQVTVVDDEGSSVSGTRNRPVIAAGRGHAVAVKSDGSLWAWGANGSGQLGTGADFGLATNAPARVGSGNDWATVAVGASHTLAVKADGTLWAWGDNCIGQLGLGGDCGQTTNAPARVGADNDWMLVAAGDYHSVGLKADGSVWLWGSLNGTNRPTKVGTDFDWAWIAAGWVRALAVKQDGTLWELNANDLTPIGTDSDWEMVVTAGGVVPLGHWQSYTSDVLALKSDASLWSWGGNGAGQLGDGTTISRNEPGHVGTDLDWTALSAAAYHSLGLKSDGSLWAWGANGSGQLGVDTQGGSVLEPNRVGLDSDWAAVAAGQNFSIGLRSDGSLWAWGWNGLGQLGLGGEFNEDRTTPTRIGSDNNWAQPSAPTARGDFRIFAQSINPDHSRTLYFTHTNYRAYYVLERGDVITNIHQPVGMALASAYPQLRDPSPLASDVAIFYRIRAVPRAQPLDLDGDGIDDFFELRHATLLNPLNPADAALDSDFDGYSNLAEYRAGTDLARLTVRHSIALGLRHTVLLKHDGSLWAWGENTYGQLGDGTYDHRDLPVRIGVDNDWISVAAGRDPVSGDHTVALKRDGSLWAWGANNYGQLGFPDSANVPTRIGTGRSWTDVAAGGGYTMAVQRDGSLWAWGNSSVVNPCCGNSWVPTRVGTGRDWTTIAAGGQHVLALKADRSLWTWGINDWGQLGLGEGVFPGAEPTRVGTDNDWTAVAATGDTDNFNGGHSLALKADGSLWAWGHNDWGQLGHGFTGASATNFVPTRVGTDADWAAIAASSPHSMARKRDGSLWVWGFGVSAHPVGYGTNNAWGDFAVGGTLSPPTPMLATAVRSDGSLWSSILGGARNVPTFIANDSDWEFVTAGLAHTLALKTNGTAWTWGANWAGQLGDGMPGTSGFVPQLLDTGTGWSALAAGDSHTLGIQFDGTLWAWGENQYGQLGTEPSVLRAIPARIGSSNDWKAVAAGGGNSFALKNDGSLWTWGRNDHGQLGIGAAINVSVPTRVGTNQDWAVISARGEHTLALKTDGSLWAWGRNGYGQVGDGSTTDRTQPVRIGLESNWVAVAAGYAYTLALRDDGSLWAWGANWNGQLGDGTRMDRSSPVRIGTQNNWAAIAASSHSLGLKTDGSLWAWGANWAGQLGIGSSMEQTSPTRVGTDTDWVSITAGGSHSLARKANGTLWSWGSNDTGQLGLAPELFPRRLGTDIDWGSPP